MKPTSCEAIEDLIQIETAYIAYIFQLLSIVWKCIRHPIRL